MPLNCDTFSHTFCLQNPLCDNLKKKRKPKNQNPRRPFLKNTDLPSPLVAETGFRVFGARQIDPRKNESLNEMKDSLALNCH